jgi:hypothetical protein
MFPRSDVLNEPGSNNEEDVEGNGSDGPEAILIILIATTVIITLFIMVIMLGGAGKQADRR